MIIKKPASDATDSSDAVAPKAPLRWLLSNWQPILAALYALVFFAVVASVPAEGAPNDVAASSDWITDLMVSE